MKRSRPTTSLLLLSLSPVYFTTEAFVVPLRLGPSFLPASRRLLSHRRRRPRATCAASSFYDDEEDDTSLAAFTNHTFASPSLPVLTLDDLSAAFASNVSYFYLQNELGLSEEALWRVTYEAGSALGMTTETIRRKVKVLQETMNLSREDICTIIERHPTILHLSADKNLAPTILFLVRALDMGKDELRSLVLACPAILSYSIRTLRSKINFWTRIMRFKVAECRQIWLKEPNLIRSSVTNGLATRMHFWMKEMKIPLATLRTMVFHHPRMLLYSVHEKLIPTCIYFLLLSLQLSTIQVHKLLQDYPAFLDYNLDRHVLPIAKYFVDEIEFSPNEVGKILLKSPRLVSHSLYKLKHVVGYLRFELGLQASQVKRVLFQAPQVLNFADETLQGKVQFVRDALELETVEQLQRILAGMPTILTLGQENLETKLVFLRKSFGNDPVQLRQAVLRLPTLLGYSIKRIEPRMQRILQAGLDPCSITVGISMKEADFDGWLARRGARERKQRSAIVRVSTNEETEPGRITHWTRERRKPRGS